jgi:hypothetical protein
MSRWTAQATRIVVRIANRAQCSAMVRSASAAIFVDGFIIEREDQQYAA